MKIHKNVCIKIVKDKVSCNLEICKLPEDISQKICILISINIILNISLTYHFVVILNDRLLCFITVYITFVYLISRIINEFMFVRNIGKLFCDRDQITLNLKKYLNVQ